MFLTKILAKRHVNAKRKRFFVLCKHAHCVASIILKFTSANDRGCFETMFSLLSFYWYNSILLSEVDISIFIPHVYHPAACYNGR